MQARQRAAIYEMKDPLEFLEAMVAMESPSFDKPLVDKFVRFVGSRFAEIGGQVTYVHAERFGDHLVARFGAPTEGGILLLGHTDPVWTAGELARRPIKIEIGRAAHAGIDPEKGINAIEEISRQILKLQKMTDAASGTTVTVGVVHGGARSNVVPAEAAAEIDVRIASVDEAARIATRIKAL